MEKVIKKRDTNIEGLRILCMIMIVCLHYIQHGGIFEEEFQSTIGYNILLIIKVLCLVAVNCFFLITGYYSSKTKFNLKKILKLWGKTIFYSIAIYVICYMFDYQHIGGDFEWITSFFPILTGSYWFLTVYITLLFILPFLNKIIENITKNQFQFLLVLMIIGNGVIGMIFEGAELFFSKLSIGVTMYFMGAYIKQYYQKKGKSRYVLYYLIISVIIIITYLLVTNIVTKDSDHLILMRVYQKWLEAQNILIIFASVFVFLKFLSIEIKSLQLNRMIMMISPSIVSIYIIHENHISRHWWKELLHTQAYTDSYFVIFHLAVCVIGVFVGCVVIDKIRLWITNQICKLKIIIKIDSKIGQLCDRINNIVNTDEKEQAKKEREICQN